MPKTVTEKQRKNLVSLADRPLEERRSIASQGGKAVKGKQQERKLIREAVADILSRPAVVNGKAILDPTTGEPMENMQAAVIAATLRAALKGDHKAAAKLVEWLGESNTPAGVNINVSLGK